MWVKRSNRKSLTEILLGNGIETSMECHHSDSFPVDPIAGNDLYLIWDLEPKDKRAVPNIIVVSNGHLRDFLAWAITYFPAYRPFTAYFRVVEFDMLASLQTWFEPPSLYGLETACVGIIIAEALLLSSAREKAASISTISCSTTISYALSRALALGANSSQLEFVYEKWLIARKLTEQPERKLDIEHLKDIYHMLAILRHDGLEKQQLDLITKVPKAVIEACSQLKNKGRISDKTWGDLTEGVQELKDAQRQMESTREARVKYFQRLLSNDSFSKLNGAVVQAFVCGYLGSLIGPGTLSHVDLVARYLSQSPMALLWYGLCAGFYKKNELLTSFNVLGRRLLRELLRYEPLLSPPVSDISLTELQVLLESNGAPIDFRTFVSNRVTTELYPCISTYLIWPKRESKQQMDLFSKSNDSALRRELLLDLGSLLKEALNIHQLLLEPGKQNDVSGTDPSRKIMKKKRKK